MPEVTTFMISDRTQEMGGVVQLINPTSSLRVPSIPSAFSFAISVGIVDVPVGNENTMMVSIFSPSGELIHRMDPVSLPMAQLRASNPGASECDFNMNLDIHNLFLKEEGRYTFEVFLNSTLLSKTPIIVRG